MNPVDPHVHEVAFRQVPTPERLVLRVPGRRQSRDVRRTQARRVLAEQHRQRLAEVARRQPAQIQQRKHLGHLRRPPQIRRQDPAREPLPLALLVNPPVVHPRRTNLHRPPPRRSPFATAHGRCGPPAAGRPRRAHRRAPRCSVQPLPPTRRPASVVRPQPRRHGPVFEVQLEAEADLAIAIMRVDEAPEPAQVDLGAAQFGPAGVDLAVAQQLVRVAERVENRALARRCCARRGA